MANATFYVMAPDAEPDHLTLACLLASDCYRRGQPVYIHCQDQGQSHEIDEKLWQFDPQRFVPHNLVGEGPRGGAPVEIGHNDQFSSKKRPVLINLSATVPQFAVEFAQIFDFVPAADDAKVQARERFRAYRQLKVALTTHDLAKQPLSF
ncbi:MULTISPECIES: DNA polymerase III subunit chi [Ferrimonas]|uniref:DNA polymerase III subunit chi n=1 Tax=Ferrimonas TaxID=44011 RepID=UPI0003F5BB3B|nr:MULTISPECIES: DNA polymerase III subunit chi [Ferrimonas]USD38016.1 DNA polymerase III subunit chi [Ferrimonas sp. SCSIO 43195]